MKDYFAEVVAQTNSEKACELWVRYRIADWLTHQGYYFGIWDKSSAQLIGFISIINIDWKLPKGEIQFFIDSKQARKGVMTEVLNELVDFAFQQLKMQKLVIKTGIEYYPPQRLARKCGFNREGDLRSEFKKASGEIMDVMLFGLSFTTYEKY